MRQRRKKRAGGAELPLFGGVAVVEAPLPEGVASPQPPPTPPAVALVDDDLPLNAHVGEDGLSQAPRSRDLLDVDEPEGDIDRDLAAHPPLPKPTRTLERPATLGERVSAGLVDVGILLVLSLGVVYFTGRAGRISRDGLGVTSPWVFAFLSLLWWSYAGAFTGTTGQTPGKLLQGLRVVDVAGRAPSLSRSLGRAALGAFGILLAGLGMVTVFLDPAARAVHDHVFRTRVVKK